MGGEATGGVKHEENRLNKREQKMSKVQVFIDGKPVVADSNQTILQVCRDQGIHIPTLCHDDQLEPFTSCFLCVVEVEGARTFVPSCGTKVSQGMKITTENERLREARKMALELLLSNHYADCLGPCKITCPAGVDVQGYLALAAMGKYKEAIALIKQTNPLPTVCGRVCTRPCELACRRNLVDEAEAIDHVKRFLADYDLESPDRYFPEVKPDSGHKVAIIGAGPAGLSCAYYLRQEGHTVHIFDAKPKPGGMLRWGIPEYRLPEKILDKEIEGITKLGVEIYCNKALGRDFTIDSLFDEGYEAIFLGLGAQASTSMRVENEDAEGVLAGIEFLEEVKLGKVKKLSGKVAVIGGGNTAMDAARTALRLGADEVSIVYRRTIKEMPANKIEIEEAQEEGVKFVFLTAPVKILTDENNRVRGMECVKMELGPPDASGRRRPIPIEGSNYEMEVDWVIAAIGQKPDLEYAGKDGKLLEVKTTRWGTLEVRPEIMETNIPGVFAGGDVVLGPATAIEAIADGGKAAKAIHKYITGETLDLPKKPFISRKENLRAPQPEDFASVPKIPRVKMPVRDPKERAHSWEEVELGFSEEQVHQEALRCLECGCQAFYECDLQKHSTDYEADQTAFQGEFHDLPADTSHPFIQIELNKCILCGRCVRICDEVMGLGVFGFVKRGFDTKVRPVLEVPLAESHCISCGQCVETCPTGAIVDKPDAVKPGPWILEKHPTICQYCSVGCTMNADVLDDRIIKISADRQAVVNEFGNLCVRGRYGFRYVNSEERLTQPLIRKNGTLQPVSWDEAFLFTARRIMDMKKQDAEWAVFGSPTATNEENYLLQKFARVVLGTNNVGSLSNLNDVPEELLRASMSNTTFDAIEKSDFLLVGNYDPMETHPVVYIKLQKATRRGQTLYILNQPESRLAKRGHNLPVPDERKVDFLKFLVYQIIHQGKYARSATQDGLEALRASMQGDIQQWTAQDFGLKKGEFNTFFRKLLKARHPLFICNRSAGDPETVQWLNSMAFVLGKNEILLSLPAEANYQGMLDMGIHPEFLPGYQRVDNPQVRERFAREWGAALPEKPGLATKKLLSRWSKGKIDGAIFWAQDPLGTGEVKWKKSSGQFMIVGDMFLTETAKEADVVFPLAPFAEITGTITNAEGRVQHFRAALPSKTSRENWQILVDLSAALGHLFKLQRSEEVTAEIEHLIPEYRHEIALFRNGYRPKPELISGIRKQHIPYGGNHLLKWFDTFSASRQVKYRTSDLQFILKM